MKSHNKTVMDSSRRMFPGLWVLALNCDIHFE